jgi:hypothetical protein
MAGRIDSHTSTLLAEGHSLDQALGFHLTARCFPPSGFAQTAAKRAITLVNQGEPDRRVVMPEGISHRRYGRSVPAIAVIEGFNLWCFIDDDGEG